MSSSSSGSIEKRTETLDTIAAVLPMNRRDMLAGILTDEDVETLRHLVNEGMGENTLRALTSDLAYLEAHYGLSISLERYTVYYEVVAGNLPPIIDIRLAETPFEMMPTDEWGAADGT